MLSKEGTPRLINRKLEETISETHKQLSVRENDNSNKPVDACEISTTKKMFVISHKNTSLFNITVRLMGKKYIYIYIVENALEQTSLKEK